MISILKTITLPLVFILPWILVKINDNWGRFFQEKMVFQPNLVFIILLPSILITTGWIVKLLSKKNS